MCAIVLLLNNLVCMYFYGMLKPIYECLRAPCSDRSRTGHLRQIPLQLNFTECYQDNVHKQSVCS